jgi:long-chain fatty acid transport protein
MAPRSRTSRSNGTELGLEALERLQTGVELGPPRGAAYDATPIRNQFLTARLPDANRYWLALGFGYEWTPDLRIDAAYVHVFVASRSINETSQTGDLLTGRYSSRIDIISLSATMSF